MRKDSRKTKQELLDEVTALRERVAELEEVAKGERHALLKTVVRSGQLIARATDLRACLLDIYRCVRFELGFDRVGIFFYNPVRGCYSATIGTSRTGDMVEDWDVMIDAEAERDILNKPGWFSHTPDFGKTYPENDNPEMAGVKEHVQVSMWTGDRSMGMVCVDNLLTQRPISQEQIDVLRLFAGYAGATIHNIAERDRANSYLELANVLFVAIDADRRVTLVNRKGCKVLGYREDEIIGKNWFDSFLPLKDRAAVKTVFQQVLDGELAPYDYYENQVLTRRGEKRIIAWRSAVLKSAGGDIIGALFCGEDITERKQAEKKLRESDRWYKKLYLSFKRQAQEIKLLDQIRTELAQENDMSRAFQRAVDGLVETFHYADVSISLRQDDSLVLEYHKGAPKYVNRVAISRGVIGRIARTGVPELIKDVRVDPDFFGRDETLSEICVPLFEQGKVAGVLNVESRDDKKLSEEDLNIITAVGEHISIALDRARMYTDMQESEERLRLAVDGAQLGIWDYNIITQKGYWGGYCDQIFGFPRGTQFSPDTNFLDIVHPDDKERVEQVGYRRTCTICLIIWNIGLYGRMTVSTG